jgi:hypothetical protein
MTRDLSAKMNQHFELLVVVGDELTRSDVAICSTANLASAHA